MRPALDLIGRGRAPTGLFSVTLVFHDWSEIVEL